MSLTYRGYTIEEKKDFGNQGFVIDGFEIKHGFIVTKNGALAMPGGAWFLTTASAKQGIDDLIASGDDGARFHIIDGHPYPIHEYHIRSKLRRAVNGRSMELYRAIRAHIEQTYDATGGAQGGLRKLLEEIENTVDMRGTIVRTTGTERIGEFSPGIREILDEGLWDGVE